MGMCTSCGADFEGAGDECEDCGGSGNVKIADDLEESSDDSGDESKDD